MGEEKCDNDHVDDDDDEDEDDVAEIERNRCMPDAIMSIRKLNTLGRIMTPNRTIGLDGDRIILSVRTVRSLDRGKER